MGVPLTPLPEVRSHSEPIRSVRRRGVVPSETILPTRLPSFFFISPFIASRSASPESAEKSLSARYLSFSSFGVPSRPLVYAG